MAESVVRLFPNVALPPPQHEAREVRLVEAILFASAEPLSEADIADRLPGSADLPGLLAEIQETYASRGVNLVRVAGKWAFRTAPDLAFLMTREAVEQKKLSRAAMETLAIIAYHQPTTRADIEAIRGVATSRGALDALMEAGWVRVRGRRRVPGRPVTYGTTEAFLEHFGLESLGDLPGVDELKAAGLLDGSVDMSNPLPHPPGDEDLFADGDPLVEDDAWAAAEPNAESEPDLD